ncbi:DnaJ domain-containing protein [Desulforhopalus singaporensis]|uniref:DnaJ like chaperone protein n=1 Tax=Desulforhopalus singaporensis TaxID=91360 RepID=A0A1H0P296_9BACT|nr:DnaJ domain-containing protein [Desulforhopalus singaporensis]SDO99207.1 DnaJ like chaperone protein [Desulforhopalus singaporensis]
MQYQRQQQPGCGGCLLILLLIIFLTGGAPALISFLGTLLYTGFFGILLLFAMFWGFSYWLQKKVATYEQSQTESHNRFVWLLVQILIHTAKIDGQITRAEVQTIHRFFQTNLRYNQTQMAWVKELIKEAAQAEQSLDALLHEFKSTFTYEPRLILLELVYQILYTKTEVPEYELNIARYIADYLDISSYDQKTVEAKYRYHQQYRSYGAADSSAKHYASLGLEKGATFEEIKKAYRKLSMQYHPDKVSHLGEEFKKVAEEKMKEINAAYDYFKKNSQ